MKKTIRSNLKYGFNETDNWWYFSQGKESENIREKLSTINLSYIRVFVFDKGTPDPVSNWINFKTYIDSVLILKAKPMITFALYNFPYSDKNSIQSFSNRCSDVVWGCIEQWGEEEVSSWFWGIWNEPNNKKIGGGLTFNQYKRIYINTAKGILKYLQPIIGNNKPRIGGPAIDTFDNNWYKWIESFINEIDHNLIGFVSWHKYGDWRDLGKWNASNEIDDYINHIFEVSKEYELWSSKINSLIKDKNIMNVCGEINVNSDHNPDVSRKFNQTSIASTFYTSVLLHLIKGNADIAMWWTASDKDGPYGMIDCKGNVSPVYHAKKFISNYFKCESEIDFLEIHDNKLLIALNENAAIVINYENKYKEIDLNEYEIKNNLFKKILIIDSTTTKGFKFKNFKNKIIFKGHGTALIYY